MREARWSEEKFFGKPKRLPKGARGRGYSWERKVKKWLEKTYENVIYDRWISFEDANGKGFAQPDFVLEHKEHIIVVETKLTETENGYRQLNHLYAPLLGVIYSPKEVFGIQLCARYGGGMDAEMMNFDRFVSNPKKGRIVYSPQI